VSKTYLWEREKDVTGEKKPSAAVLLRIATALSVTMADLLDLPAVWVQTEKVELPASLEDFRRRMETLGTPLSEQDLRDLALMRFRGGQPQTVDEWHNLYAELASAASRKRKA
jgi:transcriptional regulator with XRE-family HTH domain